MRLQDVVRDKTCRAPVPNWRPRNLSVLTQAVTFFCLALLMPPPAHSRADGANKPTEVFSNLSGRWVGKGRIGFKNGAIEEIKCRATYFSENGGDGLRQTIRCASSGGKVELKNQITHDGGKLTGNWRELIYNLEGTIAGEVTKKGFRVRATGDNLQAMMEIIVIKDKQLVEVNFDSETLIGMTLVLTKG